jgi:hypothetical protein
VPWFSLSKPENKFLKMKIIFLGEKIGRKERGSGGGGGGESERMKNQHTHTSPPTTHTSL